MKPILMNAEMVCAILDGRKTVTRRVVKDPYHISGDGEVCRITGLAIHKGTNVTHGAPYPDSPYRPCDILYVRETWCKDAGRYLYRANYSDNEKFYMNGQEIDIKWRPSLHMPREAARIFPRVTDVRVERL